MESSPSRSSVCIIVECFQGKTGRILGQLSVLTGVRDILKTLITDQPKGRPGLISKAEEEGKGKGRYAKRWIANSRTSHLADSSTRDAAFTSRCLCAYFETSRTNEYKNE